MGRILQNFFSFFLGVDILWFLRQMTSRCFRYELEGEYLMGEKIWERCGFEQCFFLRQKFWKNFGVFFFFFGKKPQKVEHK